jgi:hypothetical protein
MAVLERGHRRASSKEKEMAEEYNFPPYEETMREALKAFSGELMNTYKGRDITPLRDLKGGGIAWSFKHLYKAPKLEKIAFTIHSFRDKLMSYAIAIWPDDEHALPAYNAYWAESAKGSFFLVDFYPLADCICDIPYMEHYLEPLEGIYNKGMKYFSGLSARSTNWFRALCSPYCLTGDIAPSTKDSQDKNTELWKKDEARPQEYMKGLNTRKEAIRANFREKDPGGAMIVHAVGEELAELSLMCQF